MTIVKNIDRSTIGDNDKVVTKYSFLAIDSVDAEAGPDRVHFFGWVFGSHSDVRVIGEDEFGRQTFDVSLPRPDVVDAHPEAPLACGFSFLWLVKPGSSEITLRASSGALTTLLGKVAVEGPPALASASMKAKTPPVGRFLGKKR